MSACQCGFVRQWAWLCAVVRAEWTGAAPLGKFYGQIMARMCPKDPAASSDRKRALTEEFSPRVLQESLEYHEMGRMGSRSPRRPERHTHGAAGGAAGGGVESTP